MKNIKLFGQSNQHGKIINTTVPRIIELNNADISLPSMHFTIEDFLTAQEKESQAQKTRIQIILNP